MSNGSLEEVLAGLQKSYLASLPEKIANIDSLWRAGEMEKLRTDYHKLKGTGRTYGLPEVSKLGEALERLCDKGDQQALARAVPLSLTLLKAIGDSRADGQELVLEQKDEFLEIQKLLAS